MAVPCGWEDSGIPTLVNISVCQTSCPQLGRERMKPRMQGLGSERNYNMG